MQVWHGLGEIDPGFGATVVSVGNFDGVHLGHRHVIAQARETADRLGGLPVVVVTFEPHPMTVVAPDHAPQALTTLDDRLVLLGDAGADAALVLHFDSELAGVSPTDFVTRYLLDGLRAKAVVVGENFRFGHRAAGDVALLREVAGERGVEVVGLAIDGAGAQQFSSTYVRRLIAEGDVEDAAVALGRAFSVRGYVVRGDQRGRELGFPTANVPVPITQTAVPADGVYAGWLRRLDEPDAPLLPAAISVGTNPTFEGIERRVESHVLDRDDLELYGVEIEVSFEARLRGQVKFDSIHALVVQVNADIDQARELLTR